MKGNHEMMLKKRILALLVEIYINKNTQAAMRFFNKNYAALNGLTNTQKLETYADIENWLEELFPQFPQYALNHYEFSVLIISDSYCMVCGEILLHRSKSSQKHRISSFWKKEEEWTVCALDISAPEIIEKECSEMIGHAIYDSYHNLDDKYYEKSIQLEMLLKTCGGGLAVMEDDEEFRFLYINDAMCNMVGYTQEEFFKVYKGGLWGIKDQERNEIEQQIRKHLELTGNYQCEYKTSHKNGQDIWIYTTGRYGTDSSGKKRIYSVFLDITSHKQAQLQLEIEHLHNQIVLEMNGDTILEYNYEKDEVTFREYLPNGETRNYKVSSFQKRFPKLLEKYVYKEDQETFEEFLRQPMPHGSIEFRGYQNDSTYYWYRLTVKSITQDNKTTTELVGRIHNIDQQKWLENEANLDSLTRLYNRRYMCQQMDFVLKTEDSGALVMMDIDSFKQVNDNFGHDEGDKVLILLANLLKNYFRKEDFICRIGGDEFLVFMRNISNKNIIMERCHCVLDKFIQKTKQYHPKAMPSLSIGVAMVREDRRTADDLYRCADQLLYDVKKNGKNNVKLTR